MKFGFFIPGTMLLHLLRNPYNTINKDFFIPHKSNSDLCDA